jgi:hypothetical protein
MKIKTVLAVIALALISATGVYGQDKPLTAKVSVLFSFSGSKANPKSQILVGSGDLWFWGIADDEKTMTLRPGDFAITYVIASDANGVSTAYFTVVGQTGIPQVVVYHLYQLQSCVDTSNPGWGCVHPAITAPAPTVPTTNSN